MKDDGAIMLSGKDVNFLKNMMKNNEIKRDIQDEIEKRAKEFVDKWSDEHHEDDGFYEDATKTLKEIAELARTQESLKYMKVIKEEWVSFIIPDDLDEELEKESQERMKQQFNKTK